MKVSRIDALSAGLVAAAFLMTGGFYGRLPRNVPVHWNGRGVADGFMAKPWGAFLLPLTMAAIWLLFWALPKISPHGYRLDRGRRAFAIVQVSVLAFLLAVATLALLAGTGAPIPIARAVPMFVGALLMVIGNFMPKFSRNFFVGIRTPWTLSSDEVWLRTHRLGGALFVLAGLALIVSGALDGGLAGMLGPVLVAALAPMIYSYVIYRRIERPTDSNGGHV
jgi:uncharacterized membrane protein